MVTTSTMRLNSGPGEAQPFPLHLLPPLYRERHMLLLLISQTRAQEAGASENRNFKWLGRQEKGVQMSQRRILGSSRAGHSGDLSICPSPECSLQVSCVRPAEGSPADGWVLSKSRAQGLQVSLFAILHPSNSRAGSSGSNGNMETRSSLLSSQQLYYPWETLLSDHGSASQTFYKAHSEDNLPFKKIYVLTCKYGHNIVK